MQVKSAQNTPQTKEAQKVEKAKDSFADTLRNLDQGLEYAGGALLVGAGASAATGVGGGAAIGLAAAGVFSLAASEALEYAANWLDPKGSDKKEGWL